MSQTLGSALTIQARVVGALILRELHTRFGRHNIGFLWLMIEPMMLAGGVTIGHLLGVNVQMPRGMNATQFWITGYAPWVLFRSIILRADSAIHANRTLLYHRIVTLFDIHLARATLDGAATVLSLSILLGVTAAFGVGTLPQRPLLLILALVLLWLLAFGLSLLYCAWAEVSHIAEKVIHPTIYILLPFSGVFYLIDWIPSFYHPYLLLVPIPHLIELVREGQFGDSFHSPYIDISYVLSWCLLANFFGLFALRRLRRHVVLT